MNNRERERERERERHTLGLEGRDKPARIKTCAQRLLDVVTNIMTVSTLVQKKKTLLARDPVQIRSILEEVRLLCATAVDKANRPVKKPEEHAVVNMSRSWLFLATNNLLSACSEAANYRGALIMLRAEVLGNTCSAVGQRLFKPRRTLCSGVAAGAFHVHDLWPNSNVACPTTPVQSWVVASPQATVYATVTCQADAHRCMQMLYNLVTNALKYTVQGEVHVTAAADDEKKTVTLEVSDTGIGIGQAARERIFLPFEQEDMRCPAEAVALSLEDQSDSRRYEGLGLGLAISRAVAEKHGGTLTVESEVGKGSSFKATLPYEQPEYFGRASPWDKLVSEGHQAPTEAETDDPLDRTRNVLVIACTACSVCICVVLLGRTWPGQVSVRQHLSLRHVSGQVLVVDDDQQTRHYVRDVLQRTQAERGSCARLQTISRRDLFIGLAQALSTFVSSDSSLASTLLAVQAEVVECASSHECMSLLHTGDMKPALIIMDVVLSDDTQAWQSEL
eukprot:s4018_g9.t1